MRWHELLPSWIQLIQEDAALVATLGGQRIYPSQASRPVQIPSIEYMMVGDTEAEIFGTIAIQVDYWVGSKVIDSQKVSAFKVAGLIEHRLRTLLHRDTGHVLAGERLWSRYLESRTIEYPADPGVIHRVLDFEIEAVREKYVPPEES